MRETLILILTTSTLAFAAPNASTEKSSLPEGLKSVEAHYSKIQTLGADFEQISSVASMGQKKVSSGHISIRKPNKVRWETLKPDTHLMVSDGKTFWFYTPPFDKDEQGQVIVKKTREVQSELATALLIGSFSTLTEKKWGMKIEEISPTLFKFTPKKGVAGTVQTIELSLNASKEIEKVKLNHQGGNVAEISLKNIEIGKPIPEELFGFVIPPKTERVNE